MKTHLLPFFLLLLECTNFQAEELSPIKILSRIEKAAQWQMENPCRYGEVEWHVAPFYTSMTDLYEVTGNEAYLEYVKTLGDKNDWEIGKRPYHADDHAVGLSYIKLFQHYGDTLMIAAVKKEFDRILTHLPAK